MHVPEAVALCVLTVCRVLPSWLTAAQKGAQARCGVTRISQDPDQDRL